MKLSTTGDIESLTFLTNPANWLGLRHFLRVTGLGYTADICYDAEAIDIQDDEGSDSGSPEPDFGVFEP
jgi:hypothetical protein